METIKKSKKEMGMERSRYFIFGGSTGGPGMWGASERTNGRVRGDRFKSFGIERFPWITDLRSTCFYTAPNLLKAKNPFESVYCRKREKRNLEFMIFPTNTFP